MTSEGETFPQRVIRLVFAIPYGKVASYGQIATMAGNPRAARMVVGSLNAARNRPNLPWYRLVNRNGCVALPPGEGFALQVQLLRSEGIPVSDEGAIAENGVSVFADYQWDGKPL